MYLSYRLILFNRKMNTTNLELESEFDEELLVGGLRFPIAMNNLYRTCFIDSVLNSVANSDALTEYFKNILPENKVSDKQIIYAFTNGLKSRQIVSSLMDKTYIVKRNALGLYRILCSLFIRGIDNKYDKNILHCMRLYIMYLERMSKFNADHESKVKKMYLGKSFYEYVCAADYNFIVYFNYCKKICASGKESLDYTGVIDNNLITRLGLKHITRELNEIQDVLNSIHTADLFIEIEYEAYYDKETAMNMCKECTKEYEGNYRCTDIIFDLYEKEETTPCHSVYYNIDEKVLHDDGEIIETDINNLYDLLDDGNYYVPCILHFQLRA